jgi:hypothetical protein
MQAISARIISGEVTERAMMIGKQILSERGVNGDDLSRITAVAEKAHKEEKSNRYWLWLLVFLPLWLTYKYLQVLQESSLSLQINGWCGYNRTLEG